MDGRLKLLLQLKIETLIFINRERDRSCLPDKQAALALTFVMKKREGGRDRIPIVGPMRNSERFLLFSTIISFPQPWALGEVPIVLLFRFRNIGTLSGGRKNN